LRTSYFLDIKLPEIMYTVKEFLMETESTFTFENKHKQVIITDKSLLDSSPVETDKYDIAFSLAHEQHGYVDDVFNHIKEIDPEIKVFYYRDEGQEIAMWGKNMVDHLQMVYRDLSTHVIVFVSSDYVSKRWARHEWRSVQEAILDRPEEYLLPARFDNTDLPGLHKTIAYIDLSNKSPELFAKTILQKIRSVKK
ncbi:TIR domain-containing protein, partial [bacterium]|nr:TIR domain-containing protein [bacterium]